MSKDGLKIRGFMRGQLVDAKTGKIVGDTGWGDNKLTNYGLTNLANLLCGSGGVSVGYGALGTQLSTVNMTATDIMHENSFQAINTSTSGTCTATFTCSFAGVNNSATLTIGSFGLFKTNSAGSLIAARTYASSQMTTAQNFNVTHQIQFSTGTES
jgi:hypothetical protein